VHSNTVHAELVRQRDQRAHDPPCLAARCSDGAGGRAVDPHRLNDRLRGAPRSNRPGAAIVEHAQVAKRSPAEEVTRRALSDGLFGTSTLGEQARFLAGPIDPLKPLRGMALDDIVLRPVARLLFAERLLTDEAASTIDSFALGPSHQGQRRLRATWTPPRVYVTLRIRRHCRLMARSTGCD